MNFKKIAVFTLSCIFLFSISMLIKDLVILPSKNKKVSQDIKQIYYNDNIDNNLNDLNKQNYTSKEKNKTDSNKAGNETTEINFNKLKEINSDIIGWINIPNTVVDYPVLMSDIENSQYYLNKDYSKKSTKYGSIFLDSRCNPIENSKNLTLYGHNMNDGQMFAALLKYDNLDFYKTSPVINFNINGKDEKWKIFSVFKTNVGKHKKTDFDYTIPKFKTDEDFMQFVNYIKEISNLSIPVDVQKDDIIVTLSTCSYEKEDNRTVVVARKIRENEAEQIDLDKAYNKN